MQLGNILSTAKSPVVCKDVTFRVLGEDAEGKPISAQAHAVLAFVDEDKREEYKLLARRYLEAHDYKNQPIPSDVLADEEARWFIMAALRNKDDSAQQFCPNAEYGRFRKAVIVQQISWLHREYAKYVKDEYPELLTADEQAALANDAAKK